jgi:hypothetical protein
MMRLIANRALKRYGTRELSPGDEFEAKDRHARILLASKRARKAEDRKVETRPAAYVDDEAALSRLQRQAVGLGITVDRRWGAKRVQSEIDLAIASGRRVT